MSNAQIIIDEALVQRLVASQFPQWKDLSIRQVARSGWDNRTFHLGEHLLVRMPSSADYAAQVEKEQQWLPKLAPYLPLPIPVPLAMGMPAEGYLWKWSVYAWLDGESAASAPIVDVSEFAVSLAEFLKALQRIEAHDGPQAGQHSFYRGGALSIYDAEVRQALTLLKDKIDVVAAQRVWQSALATTWQHQPVWVHGDISLGNLLVRNGKLSAVIDFGQLAVGDPACDLVMAWTFFDNESREIFRKQLALDSGTWARGRAWALWKALIIAAGIAQSNASEAMHAVQIINTVLADYSK